MKVALVYDRINKWGGAERILLFLHRIFPDAPLYTSVYNREKAPWADVFKVRPSFLQKLPFASTSHESLAILMPLAFESFDFSGYDLVISLTSEAAKGIITKPKTKHLCILLTPTRYLWSGYEEYFKNPLLKIFSYPAVKYLRFWDKIAAQRPDKLLAISTDVKQRIKKYYGLSAPTIDLPLFSLRKNTSLSAPEDYFLVISRLVYYKRVDLAVKVFNELKLPLKIIGTGSEEKSLKSMAKGNIEFLGEVSDEELSSYYQNCKGLIFPGREDFGLVMVEAQSFGKPVLAFKGGGALDIIREGVTGEFFDEQTVAELAKAVEKFNNKRYNAKMCEENAARFSFDNFKKELLTTIDNL